MENIHFKTLEFVPLFDQKQSDYEGSAQFDIFLMSYVFFLDQTNIV